MSGNIIILSSAISAGLHAVSTFESIFYFPVCPEWLRLFSASLRRALLDFGMAAAVKKINRDANDHPDDEPRPSVGGQAGHQKNAEADAERGDEPERRHAERAMDLRVGEAEDKNSGADNREREQRADGNELAEQPD